MSSNYMFAFTRGVPSAPRAPLTPRPAPRVTPSAAPSAASPSPRVLARSDRFSLNRLIHYKSTGGCRSCS